MTLDLPNEASARDIEQSLVQERANRAAATAKLGGIEQQLSAEENRPAVARERLVEAGQLGNKLANDLKLEPPPDEAALVTEARRWVLSAQAKAVAAEIRMVASSGHPMLDRAAHRSLVDAGVLPRVIGRLEVPVRFEFERLHRGSD